MKSFEDSNLAKSQNPEFGLPVTLLRDGGAACPGGHHFGVKPFYDTD